MALGVVAVDRDTFNGPKMTVEFAFEHAWRGWAHRASFPQVRAEVRRNDLLGIIHDSPRQRSGTGVAGWPSEWPFRPYIAENCDAEEAGELLEEATGVPLTGWIELANCFINDLDRHSRP